MREKIKSPSKMGNSGNTGHPKIRVTRKLWKKMKILKNGTCEKFGGAQKFWKKIGKRKKQLWKARGHL